MEERQSKLTDEAKGEKPDFKGKLDVAAWFNTDDSGSTYLSVLLGRRINLWPNQYKLEDQLPVKHELEGPIE